jgi:prephenate dehydrogenase
VNGAAGASEDGSADRLGPVLVVGTGLIGASVGLGLTRRGVTVWLRDRDPEVMAVAVRRGAGDPAPAAGEPRLVVVAVPPSSTGQVVGEELRRYPKAVVTDVASVKGPILRSLVVAGADVSRYVGGHPMAGREVSGPAAARADLLDDRPWVVAAHERSHADAVEQVTRLASLVGALPVVMPVAEHDRAVALVSHTPQVLSSLLAARLVESSEVTVSIAGQGLRDMTRIAASDPRLWREILAANADQVAGVLRAVHDDLGEVLRALGSVEHGGAESVEALLRRGNAGRDRVPGRHGSRDKPSTVVPVAVPDRPGELGRLFAAVAEAGASVEDVWIEHVLGRPTGVVEISVASDVAVALAATLSARGWDVRG